MADVENLVRVVRVLEYIGPREWIEEALAHRKIQNRTIIGPGRVISELSCSEVNLKPRHLEPCVSPSGS